MAVLSLDQVDFGEDEETEIDTPRPGSFSFVYVPGSPVPPSLLP